MIGVVFCHDETSGQIARGTNGPFAYNRMMSNERKIHNLKKKVDLVHVNDA